jgi:hypothetical protein
MTVVRNISVEPLEQRLFDENRNAFYFISHRETAAAAMIFLANDRRTQEHTTGQREHDIGARRVSADALSNRALEAGIAKPGCTALIHTSGKTNR